MKPEDIFYYSEKKGWFTKHALSVERVGLKYQISRFRNNKLNGYIAGLKSLFEIEQQLKICIEHNIFSSTMLQQFLLALEKVIRQEGVEYRIKGTCLGRVDHPELGFADIYHTFSGHYCIHKIHQNEVVQLFDAEVHEYLVELGLRENIITYRFE